MIYGPDGKQKRLIAQFLKEYGTSLGAMTYSVSNEKWLRFASLSIAQVWIRRICLPKFTVIRLSG